MYWPGPVSKLATVHWSFLNTIFINVYLHLLYLNCALRSFFQISVTMAGFFKNISSTTKILAGAKVVTDISSERSRYRHRLSFS
jgi:hypothetical protein